LIIIFIRGVTGSLTSMAPEVFRGEQYSEKADVWSYGCVCWEVVTGEYLHRPMQNPADFAARVAYKDFRLPLPESMHPTYKSLITSCWSLPDQRPNFADIISVLDDLYSSMSAAHRQDDGDDINAEREEQLTRNLSYLIVGESYTDTTAEVNVPPVDGTINRYVGNDGNNAEGVAGTEVHYINAVP